MKILYLTELIIKSILDTHILKAYCENKTELHIYTINKIDTLDEFINNKNKNNGQCYNLVIYMMHCLSKQQQILEKIGYSFYTFRLKDIIVIDDKYFFCIGSELIMPINNKTFLTFYKPPKKEEKEEKDISFCSPELLAMDSIPFKISVKTIYYSFGALAIYCLGNPSTYEHTKLYWFIKRCIIEEELRQLLFI